jgi:hypothetical protein
MFLLTPRQLSSGPIDRWLPKHSRAEIRLIPCFVVHLPPSDDILDQPPVYGIRLQPDQDVQVLVHDRETADTRGEALGERLSFLFLSSSLSLSARSRDYRRMRK